MRLQKLLAHAGVASRRAAEALITEGHVRVNGKLVEGLGAQVDPEQDRVEVDGRRIKLEAPQYRVLLKPRACLATLERPVDKDGVVRPTLARYVKDREIGWKVVAPLDFTAEGVVLLTTDGDFVEKMGKGPGLLPMTYHVKFQGTVGDAEVARLLRGWKFEQRAVKPTIVVPIATTGKNTWVEIVVREARVRALRIAGEVIRRRVLKISRTKLGDFSFEGLGMGGFRDLNKKEVAALRKVAGLASSRG
jgi:23S rRNA pseudouridine2605 synthase